MKLAHVITPIAFATAPFMAARCDAAQAPIKIGASMATMGANGALRQDQLRGYQLCVKQANEQASVLGRKIELVPATANTQLNFDFFIGLFLTDPARKIHL